MTELTNEMVNRRFEAVASGTYAPEIPGLPGLVFTKMGLKERGISSRAYASKLKELYSKGGFFSEAFLPTILEKACKESGIDLNDVLRKQREILKRYHDSIPEEFTKAFDELTDEEVALLSPEEQKEREKAIAEHGRRAMEWQQNFITEEDQKFMDQAKQIERLEQHIKSHTAEHHARAHQAVQEILVCSKKEDGATPYFSSEEEIEDFMTANTQIGITLFWKWNQWKGGLLPDFFCQ